MPPAAGAGATVATLRRRIAAQLAASCAAEDDATPDLDARLLVGHALGYGATDLILHDQESVTPAIERTVEAWADKRAAGMPVARILGEKEFWSLRFGLSEGTLVPRPDTETLVAAALATIDGAGRRAAPLTILDLGTGSGAILLALLSELPGATGLGVDLSEDAARTARRNAVAFELGERAHFLVGDWSAAISGRFDIVVSNPPYIAATDIAGLPVAVRAHDPHLALDGGAEGLAVYPGLFDSLAAIVAPQGMAFVEIGAGQAERVLQMGRERGYDAQSYRDFAGIERTIQLKPKATKIGLEIGFEAANVRSP
ncbi:MAG: peptide chain release factor N(5)-glutamine methyltransferase [Bauldia litoralis]